MNIQAQTWSWLTNYLIATPNGKASVQLEIYKEPRGGQVEAYITRLWVDTFYRGFGLGAKLLAEAERVAGGLGYAEVFLHWSEGEAADWTRRWYERSGYEEVPDRTANVPGSHLYRKRLATRTDRR